MMSQEEIIEQINEMYWEESKYYKIILIGNKKNQINENEILQNITNQNIIKITDKTKIQADINKIAEQNNLKGIFVKILLEKIEKEPEKKEEIEKAIEIGLLAFEGENQ